MPAAATAEATFIDFFLSPWGPIDLIVIAPFAGTSTELTL